MAHTKQQFLRYKMIDKELSRIPFRKVKTRQIQQALLNQLDISVTKRTIQTDIIKMRDDSQLAYFAPLKYDKKIKAWYYDDPNYSIQKFGLKEAEIDSLNFMLNVFRQYSKGGIFQIFVNAIEKIESAIQIEKGIEVSNHRIWKRVLPEIISTSDSHTAQMITLIINALDRKCLVEFYYKKFSDDKPKKRKCLPEWLKEYDGRWYLIGKDDNSKKRKTFALDRISNLKDLDEFGTPEDIDPADYYNYCLGITNHNKGPVEVLLSFDPYQGNYLKTIPFHISQKVLVDDEKEFRISIEVVPTYELYSKILSYGENVRVIAPEEVREKVINSLQNAFQNYKM